MSGAGQPANAARQASPCGAGQPANAARQASPCGAGGGGESEVQPAYAVAVSRGLAPLAGEPGDQRLAGWVRAGLAALGEGAAAVSLRIVGRQEMAELGGRFGRAARPTNVLSFPDGLQLAGGVRQLGDVALCSQVIKAESLAYNIPFQERYAQMLMHGLLHLLGYDHIEEGARQAMQRQEARLLAALGMADPYQEETHE